MKRTIGLSCAAGLIAAALAAAAVVFAACSNPSGSDSYGGGGLPTLPAYTLISIPGGEVTTTNTGSDNTTNWGAGANSAYTKPCTVAAFKIGETEVTYELWNAVKTWAESNGYTFANPGREGNDGTAGAPPTAAKTEPVTYINWRDAVVWCNAYSEASGKTAVYKYNGSVIKDSRDGNATACDGAVLDPNASGYRLPTEAEWEYAARGGVPSTSTPWTNTYAGTNTAGTGAGELGDYAWYDGNASSSTHPVKEKSPNIANLYDMSGNVLEWCQGITGSGWVFRGGGWGSNASNCALSLRISSSPNLRDDGLGFRVAQ